MNITRGKIAKAQKVVIYGVEGVGKSTLAAKFPEPLFIDMEGSTGNMDVARLDKPTSLAMFMNEVAFVRANPTVCKTLVIDTADWLERLVAENVCMAANKKSITDFGYGDGFVKLEYEMGILLNRLTDLIEIGINVVLVAHAIIRKFEQPDELGAYDRYELKLGNKTTGKTAALLKEWADMVLFCNYKTQVFSTDDKGKKFKAQGQDRVMYTTHHPSWDAKNRHDLPELLPLDFSQIAHIFTLNDAEKVEDTMTPSEPLTPVEVVPTSQQEELLSQGEALPKAVQDLLDGYKLSVDDIRTFWEQKGHFPKNMDTRYIPAEYWEKLIANWENVLLSIKEK